MSTSHTQESKWELLVWQPRLDGALESNCADHDLQITSDTMYAAGQCKHLLSKCSRVAQLLLTCSHNLRNCIVGLLVVALCSE